MNPAARARLYSLLEGSNTFKAGQQSERDRLRLLINIRVDQLRGTMGIRNREQLCAELLNLRQYLDHET
jgi:hypothetical protein